MTRRGGVRWKGPALVALAAGVLAVLRPWTVRPIETATPASFDAAAYVESIWLDRVLPEAERTAVDVSTVLTAAPGPAAASVPPPRRSVFVKGAGVIADVDRRSQVGLARVSMVGAAPVAIQIGPVLRGTALRDAVSFIHFTDFVNQLEFASVANALNERVSRQVLASVDAGHLVGKRVVFLGAVTIGGPRGDGPIDVLPLKLEISGGGQ